MLRRPAVVAASVFVAGFALIWLGLSPTSGDPIQFCPDAPQAEGTSISVRPALWPPGTWTCDYGSTSRIYVPAREWLALAFLAAAAAATVAGRFLAAVALVVAAFAAAFL